jgi:hypothetical protein
LLSFIPLQTKNFCSTRDSLFRNKLKEAQDL